MTIKKKITLGVISTITIFAFVSFTIHFISRHKGIIINEKTVVEIGKRAGFNMNDSANFGRRIQRKYNELTTEQCRKVFYVILSKNEMPKIIKVLSPGLREELINETAERLRKYREDMTEKEREKIRKELGSLEGQKMVHRAKYYYFDGFTAEERSEISPIVSEVLKILSCL